MTIAREAQTSRNDNKMKQRESGLPFDDIRNLGNALPDANLDAQSHTLEQLQLDQTLLGSRVAEICSWYSAWSGRSPVIHRPLLTVFAGTHMLQDRLDDGVVSKQLLDSVTAVSQGDAAVNRICHEHDIGLKLFDLALQIPVADISQDAALDEKGCAGTVAFGMEAIAGGSDLLALCAIAKDTDPSALAILCALGDFHLDALPIASSTAGENVGELIEQACALAKPHLSNPLEVLRRLGGRETAAICGAILAARTEHVPVVISGVTGLAACAVLKHLQADSIGHCILASGFENTTLNDYADTLGLVKVVDQPLSPIAEANAALAAGLVKSLCKHFSAGVQATSEFLDGAEV